MKSHLDFTLKNKHFYSNIILCGEKKRIKEGQRKNSSKIERIRGEEMRRGKTRYKFHFASSTAMFWYKIETENSSLTFYIKLKLLSGAGLNLLIPIITIYHKSARFWKKREKWDLLLQDFASPKAQFWQHVCVVHLHMCTCMREHIQKNKQSETIVCTA